MKIQWKRFALPAAVVLAAVLALALLLHPSAPAVSYENLIVNGDFSNLDSSGHPVSWFMDAYNGLVGSDFEVVETDEGMAAHIVNLEERDARFAQTVSVTPNAYYRLHGYIKSEAAGGKGANLSIEGVYAFTDALFDTKGEWQEVTLYGRTGAKQTSLNVLARLGGYSGEAAGEAYFRDVTFNRVESVPAGNTVYQFVYENTPSDSSASSQSGTASKILVAAAAVYLLFFILLCSFLRKDQTEAEGRNAKLQSWLFPLFLLFAFAIRFFAAFLIPGYDVDITCFRAWADRMASVGPGAFYSPDVFCDYPPGYMLILWILGLFGKLLQTGVTAFMIKLPPILADAALCAVLFLSARKYQLSKRASFAIALFYALNPLVIITGSAWGQADALMTVLLVLSVLFVTRGKWKWALPFYMAAVLFKPQALMFGPLGLTALIFHLVKAWKDENERKAAVRDFLLGIVYLIIVLAAIALPFTFQQSWDWLITLYKNTMGGYAYASVNFCNLYFIFGKNWVGADNLVEGFWLPLALYCLAVLPLLYASAKRAPIFKGDLGDKKDQIRLYILGGLALLLGVSLICMGLLDVLTFNALGKAMIAYSVLVTCALFALSMDMKTLPTYGAIALVLLCNTGTMMHERYLFPAVGLLVLGYILKRDVRILWLAVGVSASSFLNVGCALDRNIRIGGAAGHLNAPLASLKSDMAVLEYASAGLNCLVSFCALSLGSLLSRGETVKILDTGRKASPLPQAITGRKMTRRDFGIMALVTVLYAGLAFTNLGSMKAPQTAFVSSAPDEVVLLDLGDQHRFKMAYFGGIHQTDGTFSIEVSSDGKNWTQYHEANMNMGDCFKWKYVSSYPDGSKPDELTGRYVRINANRYKFTLFETIFRDFETGKSIPAALARELVLKYDDNGTAVDYVDNGNETAAFLVDEPDTMEGEPGWYNSTYFDEIYHARTGYEHLHKMQTYETTHPPLGKVFISWCIAIFGMTPFGWRFAGALAGVLMLPGMYLLGKLLTKRWWGGLGASALLALDLMHFTQTRIATIDSFVVLFIIWMVYFMLCWFFQDEFALPLWKALIPLGLSGLCMGLGVASKWTACYVGLILAAIFFMGIYRKARLVKAAKTIPEKQRALKDDAAAKGSRRLLITVASCLIFFVLIPLLIYYLSYIPYFAYDGVGVTPKKVIEAAVGTYFTNGQLGGMLGYHSEPGRGMDHYFYSPWYQWPVIGKPMWYASNDFEPEGCQSSIMALGNPAVWWIGFICILIVFVLWIRHHQLKDTTLSFFVEKDDPRYGLILLCYFGQMVPWMLVPRGIYIYHYFPCVPFLVLSIILCLDHMAESLAVANGEAIPPAKQRRKENAALYALIALLILALILFILFFPYASGVAVSQSWMDAMKWFPGWLWY